MAKLGSNRNGTGGAVLRQMVVVSRARDGLRPSDTSDIIGVSRANNARTGLTGVLLYSGQTFLQFVEGSDAALSVLWRELLIDDRHRQLVSLHDGQVHARWFDDWRAGYIPETLLAPVILRWRGVSAPLRDADLVELHSFLRVAQTF
jgi:hypothetical protein